MSRTNCVLAVLATVMLTVASLGTATGDVIRQQPGTDFLIVEAEAFESLEGPEDTTFIVVGTEAPLESNKGALILPPDTNASGGLALYDQVGGGFLAGSATWKVQFATPGLYTLYARYSLFDDRDNSQGDINYANEDSLFLPLDFNEPAVQEGRFDLNRHGHNDPLEAPPFWEGQFHWTPDEPATWEDDSPAEYNVTAGEVGVALDFTIGTRERGVALDVLVFSLDEFLLQEDLDELLEAHQGPGGSALQAGDADQDLDFDQLDLVQVQIAAKYLTGQPATWGEGDWNAAPGGEQGSPPPGNGLFDQLDIIAALAHGLYLRGPYAAIQPGGEPNDGQTSVGYNVATGEVFVDAPAGRELTSINIDSAGGIFTGDPAQNLNGSFDNDADNNVFKATFGSSFGSLSFGNVAQAGLSEDFVANDLTVVGSLAGGGDLGNVDLIYIPEPSTMGLLGLGLLGAILIRRRR